jgi:NAD(P)H-hydrate epimerase
MIEWTGDNTAGFVVMSRQAARDFDAWAIQTVGIAGAVLMENAGRGAAEVVADVLGFSAGRAVVFCGGGNNGGDGFVIARHLHNRGGRVQIVLCADAAQLTGDARANYDICRRMHLPIMLLDVHSPHLLTTIKTLCGGCDVIIDALFGTGLGRPLDEPMVRLISGLNARCLPIVAVDIPSGLDCDTGLPLPVCIEATATVTFGGLKQGFVQNPASRAATGRIFIVSIGIEPSEHKDNH